jgi:hypothetical protein
MADSGDLARRLVADRGRVTLSREKEKGPTER